MDTKLTERQEYDSLMAELKRERQSFEPHWRDLGDHYLPRRPRWLFDNVNDGRRQNQKIIDSSPRISVRTMASGMTSGITSPARPWFKLSTPDPALAEIPVVKRWLWIVTQRLQTMFSRSNIYNILPTTYADMGVFATGGIIVEEDFEDGLRGFSTPIGSYYVATDHKGRIRVFGREFQMTVRHLVDKFGRSDEDPTKIDWSRFSKHVKSLYDRSQLETWVYVTHCIRPNPEWDPSKFESKFKRFVSVYYESGRGSGKHTTENYRDDIGGKFLRKKGYDYFPFLGPRWAVTGEDSWGSDCPGMTALGDNRQLQLGEKRIAQAVEKIIRPPMNGPTALKKQKASTLPGDITYVDTHAGGQKFEPSHTVDPRVIELENKQEQIRHRISRAFYEDLFLMLAQSDRRQITAREIEERHEEKLLALGPVLEQLNQDLLNPLIDIAFAIALRQEQIPEPPEELQGVPLKVEYISIMAQAQKMVGIGSLERFTGYIGQLAEFDPHALKKFNTGQAVDVYGDLLGVAPGVIRSDEEVQQMVQQEQAAAAAQQKMAMMKEAAGAAKDLSQANMEGDNALSRISDQSRAGQLVNQ